MKGMSRHGHYKRLREIAARSELANITEEELALMSDNELMDKMSAHYVFVKYHDEDQEDYEEEVILIPRDEWDALHLERCYR